MRAGMEWQAFMPAHRLPDPSVRRMKEGRPLMVTLDAYGTWGRPYERRPSPVRYGCRFAQIESGKRSWIATQTRFADADDLPSRKYSAMPRQ